MYDLTGQRDVIDPGELDPLDVADDGEPRRLRRHAGECHIRPSTP
jgi:hypothetical protein